MVILCRDAEYISVFLILVDNRVKILPCDKVLSFVYNNKKNHVYFTVSKGKPKRIDKASLLTASGVLLHAITSMFASLRKFPVNCAYKQLTKFFY